MLRERRDRGADERALRLRQGRSRGAPRRRRDLHGGPAGDDRQRRLADERVRHARAGAVLRRHVLPARAAPRACRAGRRCCRPSRRRGTRSARRSARRTTRWPRAWAAPRACSRPPGRPDEQILDDAVAALRARYDAVNGGWGGAPKFPAASVIEFLLRRGETQMSLYTLRSMASRRHQRPDRRRLRALLDRRELDGPALREDALRQRAAGRRLPARLAGERRARRGPRPDPAADRRGDARLGAARDDRARGRVLQRPGRRLRGRRGQVLRVEPGRAAQRPRRRRRRRDRLVRRQRARQLRGREHPRVARPGACARGARAHPRRAAGGARRARLARRRRQAPDGLERAHDPRARRGRRRARARGLPRRRAARRGVRARRDARRRRPAAAHLQRRRGEAQRLPRGPRLHARGAAGALRGDVRAALVWSRARARRRR